MIHCAQYWTIFWFDYNSLGSLKSFFFRLCCFHESPKITPTNSTKSRSETHFMEHNFYGLTLRIRSRNWSRLILSIILLLLCIFKVWSIWKIYLTYALLTLAYLFSSFFFFVLLILVLTQFCIFVLFFSLGIVF